MPRVGRQHSNLSAYQYIKQFFHRVLSAHSPGPARSEHEATRVADALAPFIS